MRILHTSDWHLGKSLNSQFLIEDQKHFLNQIKKNLESAESEGKEFQALIVSGDIFDRSIPPSEAVTLLDDFLCDVCFKHKKLHVFMVCGNHDSATRLGFGTSFFAKEKIHICCSTENIDCPVVLEENGEKLCVYQIPYLYPGSLSPKTNEREKNSILKTQQELFDLAIQTINEKHQTNYGDAISLLNAHLFAKGAKDGDMDYERVGNSEVVDVSIFEQFDYAALGHIHAFQKLNKKGNCYYSGSPLAYAFDEQSQKFFLDVELKKGDLPHVTKIAVEPLHKVSKLIKSWNTLFGPEQDKILIEKCRNDYIQVICTDKISVSAPLELLKGIFPNLLSFKIMEREGKATQTSALNKRKILDSTAQDKAELIFDAFMKDLSCGESTDQQMLEKEKTLFLEIAKKMQW